MTDPSQSQPSSLRPDVAIDGDAEVVQSVIVSGGTVQGPIIGKQIILHQAPPPTTAPAAYRDTAQELRTAWRPEDRSAMLAKVRHIWIDGVLQQSLWHDALIALRLAERSDAVARPYGLRLRSGADETPLLEGTTIQDFYAAQRGMLLILGQPGSGKTTLLLELTQTLLDRAQQDPDQLIPVIFNLATWTEQQTLANWLVSQLHHEYDVPQKICQAWINTGAVLPLLDGLDELAEARRAVCIDAINTYHREHETAWAMPMVVSCRLREYEALPQLRLYSAIVVQPLTGLEIDRYLRDGGHALAGVRAVVNDDSTLYELLETPLLLAVTILAFSDQPVDTLRHTSDPAQRRRAIFAAYIDRVFHSPPLGKGVDPRYGQAQTLRWLAWLARQMRTYDQSIYWIEFMQLRPVSKRSISWAPNIVSGLVFGLIFGIIGGLGVGWIFGLFGGLTGALVGGLGNIEPIDKIQWKPQALITQSNWVSALIFGLIFGLISGLVSGLNRGLIFSLGGVLIGVLIGGLEFLGSRVIDHRTRPNEGIHRSIHNLIIVALIFGLSGGLGGTLLFGLDEGLSSGLEGGIIFGLIAGLIAGLRYGGEAVIKHYTLRLLLTLTGTFPWSITAFLDSCAARGLVQRIGGGWRFPHNLIRDYFTEVDET